MFYDIVKVVWDVVFFYILVLVKIWLGFEDKSLVVDNVMVIIEVGVFEFVVYVWIKMEGYKFFVYWEWIVKIK